MNFNYQNQIKQSSNNKNEPKYQNHHQFYHKHQGYLGDSPQVGARQSGSGEQLPLESAGDADAGVGVDVIINDDLEGCATIRQGSWGSGVAR